MIAKLKVLLGRRESRKVLYAILGGKAIGLGVILAVIWGLPSYFGHPAQAADAATNSARPAVNMRWRPRRSPSAAPVSNSTAKLRL